MCYAVPCRTCGKTTWQGCGQHIAEVRAQVPPSQWCDGHPDAGQAKARPWWRRRKTSGL